MLSFAVVNDRFLSQNWRSHTSSLLVADISPTSPTEMSPPPLPSSSALLPLYFQFLIFFPTLPGQACSPFLFPLLQAFWVLVSPFGPQGQSVPLMAYTVCSNLLHHLLCKPEICHGMLVVVAKGWETHRSPCPGLWKKVRLTFSILSLLLKLPFHHFFGSTGVFSTSNIFISFLLTVSWRSAYSSFVLWYFSQVKDIFLVAKTVLIVCVLLCDTFSSTNKVIPL